MSTIIRFVLTLVFLSTASGAVHAQLVNSEWNTGSGDWNVATNWFPNDVPDNGGGITYDVEIGNRPVAAAAGVTFIPEDGTSDSITSLTITNAADLFTNGFLVFVTGQTTIDGVGSTIRVDSHDTPGTFAFDTDNLDLNNGGGISMNGGILNVDILMEINAGSVLGGNGTVNAGDADAVVEQAFENSSLIQVSGDTAAPQTLTIEVNGVDTIDLDGDSETGIVDVDNTLVNVNSDTITLVVDGPLGDAFSGTLQIGQRDTVTFNNDFTISGAAITMDGGNDVATLNGPANITDVASSTFTITGDAVIDNDMTFTGTANTITINAASSLQLDGAVSIPDASALVFATSTANLIVAGPTAITEVAGDFNWDGLGTASTTVQGTGSLSLTVNRVDTADDTYGGTLNLNDNGDVSVQNTANQWTAAGTINKNNAGTSTISGDRVVLTGNINVNAGTLDMPATTLSPGADVAVTGLLTLGGASDLAGPTTLTGPGTLRMEGTSTVSASTTINVATFDWDGLGTGTTHTIDDGVVFTINSPTFDTDGDMDDPINLGGNGAQLVVSGSTEWTMNRTLTTNTAAAGTATITGSSRLILSTATGILNVDGNTNLLGPITFGTSSVTSIDAAMTLNAQGNTIYGGGTIGGAGTYDAGPINTVTADSTINVTNFNFDAGNWTIENDVALTVNVSDYDPDSVTNAFNGTITLNGGDIDLNTADASFVMDGTLHLFGSSTQIAFWDGEPVDIGNDTGVNNADMNANGNPAQYDPIRFGAPVTFKSDADVHVADGAELEFWDLVVFDTVNAANNAEFTGDGIITFHEGANVNEAVTLNMVGGLVNLCGFDSDGDFVNIDAPLTINASILTDFGKNNAGGGIDTLDVNNSVGTGVLTVNLDDPTDEWTLNPEGVMNLVNGNVAATLLAGSDVNLDGTVNVTGDVRTTARVDISGTVNINTAGQPFRLAGGGVGDPNTLAGGTINGPGILGGDSGINLNGFGTINATIDFDGDADLFAEGGTLTVNGTILDADAVGAVSAGVLNIPAAWETDGGPGNTIGTVALFDGTLQGGTITNDNPNGINGRGTVASRVINDTRIDAENGGSLIVQTAANNNDWDGSANTGQLNAISGTLEVRDNALFNFLGSSQLGTNHELFINGFDLRFVAGSSLAMSAGSRLRGTNSTDFGGTITVAAGAAAEIQYPTSFVFASTSNVTITGTLRVANTLNTIQSGAVFSGGGTLVNPAGSALRLIDNADVGVLVQNQGTMDLGVGGIPNAQVTGLDFQQDASGSLAITLGGTGLAQFDRLDLTGAAQLAGALTVSLNGGFVPVLGNTFAFLTATAGVSGTFSDYDLPSIGLVNSLAVIYGANNVTLQVIAGLWGDYNGNGVVDAADYTVWRDTLGAAVAAFSGADGSGNGLIDEADYTVWKGNFGAALGPGAGSGSLATSAVPEPTSLVLLFGGVALGGLVRRRHPTN